jgi:hypothetical protein
VNRLGRLGGTARRIRHVEPTARVGGGAPFCEGNHGTIERVGDNVPLRSIRDLGHRGGLATSQARQRAASGLDFQIE